MSSNTVKLKMFTRAKGMSNYYQYQYTVITHRYKKQLAQHTVQWERRVVKVADMLLITRDTYKSMTALLLQINSQCKS